MVIKTTAMSMWQHVKLQWKRLVSAILLTIPVEVHIGIDSQSAYVMATSQLFPVIQDILSYAGTLSCKQVKLKKVLTILQIY